LIATCLKNLESVILNSNPKVTAIRPLLSLPSVKVICAAHTGVDLTLDDIEQFPNKPSLRALHVEETPTSREISQKIAVVLEMKTSKILESEMIKKEKMKGFFKLYGDQVQSQKGLQIEE